MTQGNVRQMFIRAYPGEVIPGKRGFGTDVVIVEGLVSEMQVGEHQIT